MTMTASHSPSRTALHSKRLPAKIAHQKVGMLTANLPRASKQKLSRREETQIIRNTCNVALVTSAIPL